MQLNCSAPGGSWELLPQKGLDKAGNCTTTPLSPALQLPGKVACLQVEMEVLPTPGQGGVTGTYWNFLICRISGDKVEGLGEWQKGVQSSTTPDFPSTPVAQGHKGNRLEDFGGRIQVGLSTASAAHRESVARR